KFLKIILFYGKNSNRRIGFQPVQLIKKQDKRLKPDKLIRENNSNGRIGFQPVQLLKKWNSFPACPVNGRKQQAESSIAFFHDK
ncbi:MAG: hypothetical protein ACKO2V_23450, partial [Snowella sp.]